MREKTLSAIIDENENVLAHITTDIDLRDGEKVQYEYQNVLTPDRKTYLNSVGFGKISRERKHIRQITIDTNVAHVIEDNDNCKRIGIYASDYLTPEEMEYYKKMKVRTISY